MIIDGLLVLLLLISCYTDIKKRKIYNSVLLPSALAALGCHLFSSGYGGLVFGLKGAVLGMSLLLIPYMLGGMGAGDVKLLAVVGLFKGAEFVFCSFLLTALAGGVISLLLLLRGGVFVKTVGQLARRLQTALMARFGCMNRFTGCEEDKGLCLPYGVAIMLGSLTTYVVM